MKVFDLSHTSEYRSYSPGTEGFECCWQTFTAFEDGIILEAGLKFKEICDDAPLTDYIVTLNEYDPANETPSAEMARVILPGNEIVACREVTIKFENTRLVRKRRYAIIISLRERAGRMVVPRFAWLAGEQRRDEQSGGAKDTAMLNRTPETRGLWLKVYYQENIAAQNRTEILIDKPEHNVLGVGEQTRLKVTCSSDDVEWTTTRADVASVNSEGIVRATGAGTCKIIARAGKDYAEIYIGVPDTDGRITPFPGMMIDRSTNLKRGSYSFHGLAGIEITGNDLILNGNGAWIESGDIFSGCGITIIGRKNITIENVILRGFHQGIHAQNTESLYLKNADFSKNYSDPSFGWGDGNLYGGIILEKVTRSVVENCRAVENWNGLALHYCKETTVHYNDFSHCSNVCLKLWNSSHNSITDNNLSHGIRLSPGEVHARDATSVLIESGSDRNRFINNNCTYGGDGIFIRALNGWPSTGNYFENNDCSYANNNGFESWCEGNVYIRNKANHCSYGFWLGGSDNTLMIGNEAAYNGTLLRNAPEPFGNAGVSVVNGASSHFTFIDNYVHDNNGPGLAVLFSKDYPAYHWIIQNNRIVNNRSYCDSIRNRSYEGHGIYLKNAAWIEIAGNDLSGNDGKAVCIADNVHDVFVRKGGNNTPSATIIASADYYTAGDEVVFSAGNKAYDEKTSYRWEINREVFTGREVQFKIPSPGFYRVCLTVTNGFSSALAYKNVYAVAAGNNIVNTATLTGWTIESDGKSAWLGNSREFTLTGQGSLFCCAEDGVNHVLRYSLPDNDGMDFREKVISFAMRYHTEADSDWGNTNRKPVVRLYSDDDSYFELVPEFSYLDLLFSDAASRNPRANEAKLGWQIFDIDIAKHEGWQLSRYGQPRMDKITAVSFTIGPAQSKRCWCWLDAVKITGEA